MDQFMDMTKNIFNKNELINILYEYYENYVYIPMYISKYSAIIKFNMNDKSYHKIPKTEQKYGINNIWQYCNAVVSHNCENWVTLHINDSYTLIDDHAFGKVNVSFDENDIIISIFPRYHIIYGYNDKYISRNDENVILLRHNNYILKRIGKSYTEICLEKNNKLISQISDIPNYNGIFMYNNITFILAYTKIYTLNWGKQCTELLCDDVYYTEMTGYGNGFNSILFHGDNVIYKSEKCIRIRNIYDKQEITIIHTDDNLKYIELNIDTLIVIYDKQMKLYENYKLDSVIWFKDCIKL